MARILSGLFPTKTFPPASIVSGRSVLSRSVIHGFFNIFASSQLNR